MTFGRNAWTSAMNVVSAGIFSVPIAADSANRKMNQYAVEPITCEGFAPGLIFSTYEPADDSRSALSTPTLSSAV